MLLYENLITEMSKYEALRKAQRFVREYEIEETINLHLIRNAGWKDWEKYWTLLKISGKFVLISILNIRQLSPF